MSTRPVTAPKKNATNGAPAVRRFTVDEYYRMAETGILRPEERLELLEGEIFTMSPIGSWHAAWVDTLAAWFHDRTAGRAIVRIQNPVRLDEGSEPEPDLALVAPRPDRYTTGHPGPQDVLLLIEIADTSLRYDQEKLRLYAAAGIPEVWIYDIRRERTLVHREPTSTGYQQVTMVRRGETLSPLAFSDLVLQLAEILR